MKITNGDSIAVLCSVCLRTQNSHVVVQFDRGAKHAKHAKRAKRAKVLKVD